MNVNNYKETKYNKPFIAQRADPYILHAPDGTFYFTASVPEYDRIVLRHSNTLKGLAEAEEVTLLRKHDEGIMSLHIWAPELHYLQGNWYIYYAGGDKDDVWAIRPYILKCTGQDPMTDPWIELGLMKRADDFSFNDFSLDMTVFEHKGKLYTIWAEKVNQGQKISSLYIAELSSPTEMKTQQVLLTTPDYDWERIDFWVNEGASVFETEDKIFVTFSASATGVCYCMGLLSADKDADILDPAVWKKERYPVLESSFEYGLFGPGHNTFFTDENGKLMTSYHARPYDEIIGNPLYDINRHAYIMEVPVENGWPVFNYENNRLDLL